MINPKSVCGRRRVAISREDRSCFFNAGRRVGGHLLAETKIRKILFYRVSFSRFDFGFIVAPAPDVTRSRAKKERRANPTRLANETAKRYRLRPRRKVTVRFSRRGQVARKHHALARVCVFCVMSRPR